MSQWTPANPHFRERLHANVETPGFTRFLGTTIERVDPGISELVIAFREELGQHHGYFHGGVIGALADNACGIAAGTLAPADTYPITSEYKINIIRPANGELLIAHGSVIKPGTTVTVCRADVSCRTNEQDTLVATMLATLVNVPA
jgi:uncharacterized protein (TIGR00369 family)